MICSFFIFPDFVISNIASWIIVRGGTHRPTIKWFFHSKRTSSCGSGSWTRALLGKNAAEVKANSKRKCRRVSSSCAIFRLLFPFFFCIFFSLFSFRHLFFFVPAQPKPNLIFISPQQKRIWNVARRVIPNLRDIKATKNLLKLMLTVFVKISDGPKTMQSKKPEKELLLVFFVTAFCRTHKRSFV